MRIARTPPNWRLLFQKASSEGRFVELLAASRLESERPDRYLHWDEFRHRGRSDGLSAEERWAGLKISRSSRAQLVPLRDAQGVPFTFFVTQGMFELLHQIDLRCGGTVSIPNEVANPRTRDRYYLSSLIEEALTSSQLEGAVVTRSEAKEMLREGRRPTNAHERMVLNNFLTMQKLHDLKKAVLTPALVKEIHTRITRSTLDDASDEGRLRTEADSVRIEDVESGEVMHIPPPASQLEERLDALCSFANESEMTGYLHPVIRSMILHFWLAYDHPFVDGNGRTARALFYWSMLRHGFWLFEFISISHVILKAPKKYYRSFLHTETDENDLNYFLIHQLHTVNKAIDLLHDYTDRKRSEIHELEVILHPETGFNHRQLALLRHALKGSDAVYTVESHRTSHGVAAQTARTDLDILHKLGLLDRTTRGNAHIFRPKEDLTNLLKSLTPDAD